MKKLLTILLTLSVAFTATLGFTACGNSDVIYVDTNAFFAPFEYYDGTEIKGVDVDIMNMVGEKLGKKVVIENTDFGVIIDNVSSGVKYDCGAAGITITDARKEKVNFSTPYFTTVQYVIVKSGVLSKDGTDANNVDYVLWDSLKGKTIGVQMDTTGDIFLDGEINATEDNDYGYRGALYGSGAKEKKYESAQVAVAALQSNTIDAVIVDKIPAKYLVSKNDGLACFALYYDATTATTEEYAICVTKGNDELLNAINAVLKDLGVGGVNALVSKHLGLE